MDIRLPTGAPQGWVLGTLLNFLLTYDCNAKQRKAPEFSLSLLMTQPSVTAKQHGTEDGNQLVRGQQPLSLFSTSLKLKIRSWTTGERKEMDTSPSHLKTGEADAERFINFRFHWMQITSFICRFHKVCHNVMSIKAKGQKSIWDDVCSVTEEAATALFSSFGHQRMKTIRK